jgi:hypothetical protein
MGDLDAADHASPQTVEYFEQVDDLALWNRGGRWAELAGARELDRPDHLWGWFIEHGLTVLDVQVENAAEVNGL